MIIMKSGLRFYIFLLFMIFYVEVYYLESDFLKYLVKELY